MAALGLVFAIVGVVLTVNVGGGADRLAAFSRPFPAWLKGVGADYPLTYRFIGVVFLVAGLGVAIAGLIQRT